MKPLGAALILALICAGCGRPQPHVVGTWQAYLGSGSAAKRYYGKPAPTEIEFRDDGTYTLHLMWGARTIAETGGTYEVKGERIALTPAEALPHDTWPGREELAMDASGRAFTMRLPTGSRVPEARFVRVRGS